MDKLRSRIQILSLLIIFFIYRTISAALYNNLPEFTLWLVISITYAISLMILYIVFRQREKR
ncbi:MAG: hypothetical protein KGD68_07370 [Candidatus Lokiarchaeota archaeon]|nr:hypothetical protein [Candidatus Lokiarchaeota archaeon]